MRPSRWELRRQVLWLQALTALALIVIMTTVELAHGRKYARQLGLLEHGASPWSGLTPEWLKDQLGLVCLILGVSIAGNALVSWRVRRHTRGMGTEAIARMLDYYEGVLHAVPAVPDRRPGLLHNRGPGRAADRTQRQTAAPV